MNYKTISHLVYQIRNESETLQYDLEEIKRAQGIDIVQNDGFGSQQGAEYIKFGSAYYGYVYTVRRGAG